MVSAKRNIVSGERAIRRAVKVVGLIQRESINDSESAIAQGRFAVAGERGVLEIGFQEQILHPAGNDHPAAILGNILLIEDSTGIDDIIQHIGPGDLDRRSGSPHVETAGNGTGGSTGVGAGTGERAGRTIGDALENRIVDFDLELLSGIAGESVHQLHVALIGIDVIEREGPVMTVVDGHFYIFGFRTLVVELLPLLIIVDRQSGDGTDVDFITHVTNLTLISRVANILIKRGLIKFNKELATPKLQVTI